MTEPKKPLPDRLSLNPRSEHFDQDVLGKGLGIRFNGVEKTNVLEYSVSEGWICVPAGRSLDRFGQPMQVKLKGVVEPYYEGDAANDAATGVDPLIADVPVAVDEKGPGADAEA